MPEPKLDEAPLPPGVNSTTGGAVEVVFLEVVDDGVGVTTTTEVLVVGAGAGATLDGMNVLVLRTTIGVVGIGAVETCVTTATWVVVADAGTSTTTLVLVSGITTGPATGVSQNPIISNRRGWKYCC